MTNHDAPDEAQTNAAGQAPCYSESDQPATAHKARATPAIIAGEDDVDADHRVPTQPVPAAPDAPTPESAALLERILPLEDCERITILSKAIERFESQRDEARCELAAALKLAEQNEALRYALQHIADNISINGIYDAARTSGEQIDFSDRQQLDDFVSRNKAALAAENEALRSVLRHISKIGCMNREGDDMWCSQEFHSIYCPKGIADAALAARKELK